VFKGSRVAFEKDVTMRSHALPVDGGYEALAWRCADLAQQHHDLDYLICALGEQAACDELLVARLKKRKLYLKDEIARVEGGLRAMEGATVSA
jgi:hypothetical protein